jgi:SAM-dependent methyltransferase
MKTVLDFYKQLPFNYRDSVQEHADEIRSRNTLDHYPPLMPILNRGTTLLDVGCGAGWFCNNAAYHHATNSFGIDFNEVAIKRAKEVSEEIGVDTKFEVTSLFDFAPSKLFDVVASVGVLHHTNDCHKALEKVTSFVSPGGYLFVGLYHQFGRKPFLNYFAELKRSGASEKDLLEKYRELHPINDEVHLLSWFRDQVLHPHETQHTLFEVLKIIEPLGMTLISTSINRFEKFNTVDELISIEKELEETGNLQLANRKYYPGFFVFLAQKNL